MKAKIDAFLNSWISKKLSVFVVGSIGLFSGTLTSNDWVTIATAYVATQGFVDVVTMLKKPNNDIN